MTIRTNKRRKYDLAHHQIAALAEVAHQVHPRIILTHCPSNKEIIELLIDIKEIREWFDALFQLATDMEQRQRES
jgi:hypothetical protein